RLGFTRETDREKLNVPGAGGSRERACEQALHLRRVPRSHFARQGDQCRAVVHCRYLAQHLGGELKKVAVKKRDPLAAEYRESVGRRSFILDLMLSQELFA